jgi:hypothetical protein
MALTFTLIWAALVLSVVSSLVGGEAETVFPRIEGKALTGRKFEVPGDLAKAHNLILVAFLREQQEDVDTWIPRAESIESSDPDFAFFEFPVLPEMNPVSRWFIYQGMRGGIPSEEARARTVTFHLEKEEFKRTLGIASEDHISVFLVDPEGAVIWRSKGRWSQEKEGDLRSVLEKAGSDRPDTTQSHPEQEPDLD